MWIREKASTSRIQGHSAADMAVKRTLLEDSGSYSHLRGHCRKYDCSHLTLSLYYPPFHSALWPALQRLDCLLRSATTSHHPSAFPGFCFCPLLQQSTGLETLWNKNTVAKCNDVWTESHEQDPVPALRNLKSSRSQTNRVKQHYASEAEVIHLGIFLFTQ